MTCQEFVSFLMDYLSGELTPEVRADFDAHLNECDDCRHYLASYRTTVEVSRLACQAPPDASASEVAPEELIAAILRAARK